MSSYLIAASIDTTEQIVVAYWCYRCEVVVTDTTEYAYRL